MASCCLTIKSASLSTKQKRNNVPDRNTECRKKYIFREKTADRQTFVFYYVHQTIIIFVQILTVEMLMVNTLEPCKLVQPGFRIDAIIQFPFYFYNFFSGKIWQMKIVVTAGADPAGCMRFVGLSYCGGSSFGSGSGWAGRPMQSPAAGAIHTPTVSLPLGTTVLKYSQLYTVCGTWRVYKPNETYNGALQLCCSHDITSCSLTRLLIASIVINK